MVRVKGGTHPKYQIPSELVVKSQVTDIIDLLLQLVRHPNGVPRSCHHRKSRGTVLSTSAVPWTTTKFDGVWEKRECSFNPTATSIFALRTATRYAPPASPMDHQEAPYVTNLSDRR